MFFYTDSHCVPVGQYHKVVRKYIVSYYNTFCILPCSLTGNA